MLENIVGYVNHKFPLIAYWYWLHQLLGYNRSSVFGDISTWVYSNYLHSGPMLLLPYKTFAKIGGSLTHPTKDIYLSFEHCYFVQCCWIWISIAQLWYCIPCICRCKNKSGPCTPIRLCMVQPPRVATGQYYILKDIQTQSFYTLYFKKIKHKSILLKCLLLIRFMMGQQWLEWQHFIFPVYTRTVHKHI